MKKLKPYSIDQQRDLIRKAVTNSRRRHELWRGLQSLYRHGSIDRANEAMPAGKLQELLPDLSEETANLILPHLTIILATVADRDPQFVAVPFGGGEAAEAHRDTVEGVLDYFWQRLSATETLRDAAQDAVFLGKGIIKTGWVVVTEDEDRDEGDIAEDAMALQEGAAVLSEFSEDGPLELDLEEAAEHVATTETRTLVSQPFIEYVSPFDLFVAPGTRRLDDARWIVHRVSLPKDEVMVRFGVSEDEVMGDGVGGSSSEYVAEHVRQADERDLVGGNPDALETATLFEFYDMRTRTLTVMQVDGEKPLAEVEFAWDHGRSPFVEINNYKVDGNDFWGFGDIENAARLQSLFNDFLTKQVESASRAGNKYGVRSDLLTEDARAAIESDDPDVFIPMDLPNGEDIRNAIVAFERKGIPREQIDAKEDVQELLRLVLGINDFQAGGSGADRMSATAAAVVDGTATLRAQDKIASIERGAADTANRLVLLAQQFLPEETAIRVSRREQPVWLQVSPEDLEGEFLVRVESGSTRAVNPQTREQQGMRTLQDVVPLLLELGMDPLPAVKQALRDLGYDPDLLLQPMPEPEPEPEPEPGPPPMPGMPPGMPPGPAPLPDEPGGMDPFLQAAMAADGQGPAPSTGAMMMGYGGPPVPALAQQQGDILL